MKTRSPARTVPASPLLSGWALALLLGLSACSGGGGGSGGAGGGGAGGADPAADPVLGGKWAFVFSGTDFDYPNTYPWVDADGDAAHFVYVSKAGNLRYFVFGEGTQQEVTLPQGTKSFGRVGVLASGGAVVLTTEPITGQVGALRYDGAAVTPLDPPFGGQSMALFDLGAAVAGDAVFVAARTPTEEVAVARVEIPAAGAPGPWAADALFPGTGEVVTRVVLASDGQDVALASLSGTSTRRIQVRRNGAWEDLGAPPDAGVVALPSLVLDGAEVDYLEFQEGAQRSVLWRHDGAGWKERARSDEGECFHALAKHKGGLYTIVSTSPSTATLQAKGIARLDEGQVTRAPFDMTGAGDDGTKSRVDVADYRESYLVSRAGQLHFAYQEMGSPAIIHLYRLVAP